MRTSWSLHTEWSKCYVDSLLSPPVANTVSTGGLKKVPYGIVCLVKSHEASKWPPIPSPLRFNFTKNQSQTSRVLQRCTSLLHWPENGSLGAKWLAIRFLQLPTKQSIEAPSHSLDRRSRDRSSIVAPKKYLRQSVPRRIPFGRKLLIDVRIVDILRRKSQGGFQGY